LTAVTLRVTAQNDRLTRHKGLKRLYEDGDPRGINPEHLQKVRDILVRLDAAGTPADIDVPASSFIRSRAS